MSVNENSGVKVQWVSDFVDLIYPSVCSGCANPLLSGEQNICIKCLHELPRTNFHRSNDNVIQRIFTGRFQFEKATAYLYFVKRGIVQNMLHQLKYKGNTTTGLKLGQLAGNDLKADGFFEDVDLLLPVPLHPKKQRKRGYNQSEIIAKGISERCGVPYSPDHLLRTTNSSSQTRKSRFARWQNVERAFELNERQNLSGKHVMLIDDVITTGSTLEAAALKLTTVDGLKCSLFTLAFAQ